MGRIGEITPLGRGIAAQKTWSLILGSALLLLAGPAVTGDWVLDGELRVSEGGTWSSFLAADRRLGDGAYIFGEYGETRIDSEDLELDTRSVTLGGGFAPTETLRLGGWYTRWGRSGDITSDSLGGRVSWRGEPFRLSLLPGFRATTLHAGAPARDEDDGNGPPGGTPGPGGPGTEPGDDGPEVAEDFDLLAASLGLRGGLEWREYWHLTGSATFYSYDEDPAFLGSREGFEQLSTSGLTLAQGFPEHRYGLGVRRELEGWREVGLNLSRDRSAVDGMVAETARLHFLTPLGDAWDLRIEAGRTRTGDFPAGSFAGLTLSWYP